MAVTAYASGTLTAVVGTETTFGNAGTPYLTGTSDVAIAGTFTLHVDLINMAAGDVVELRIYQMVLTAGTRRVAYVQVFSGAQATDNIVQISVPISNELTDAGALRFTLKQTAGTARTFVWKVLSY
jgi:hypothetical protein